MKVLFSFFFIIVSFASLAQERDPSICVTGDGSEEKDIEVSLGYYQPQRGYFFLDVTTSFDIALGIGFYEQGIKTGYNPQDNCLLIQTTQSLGIGLFSYELYTGWVQNLNAQKGIFFLAPSFNVSFKYFDVAYSYSFNFKQDLVGFRPKSNLSFKIPIRSTCGFQKFNENKIWHWGEAHHGPIWY